MQLRKSLLRNYSSRSQGACATEDMKLQHSPSRSCERHTAVHNHIFKAHLVVFSTIKTQNGVWTISECHTAFLHMTSDKQQPSLNNKRVQLEYKVVNATIRLSELLILHQKTLHWKHFDESYLCRHCGNQHRFDIQERAVRPIL